MKIAVCMKWVPDPDYPLQMGPEGIKLDAPGLTYMASPLDLVACEAAVRLKESAGGTVSLITAGSVVAEAGLRSGLAIGADDATRIDFDGGGFGGGTRVGRLLAAAIALEPPDVIICGSASPDSGSGTVPTTIADRLGMPLVTGVVSISRPGLLEIQRRLSGGRRQFLQVQPPVVITVDENLCEPRYPSVLARRRADRAPITVRTEGELGVDISTSPLVLARLLGPRPLAARVVAPPRDLPARERLAFVLAGGPDQRRSSRRLEGPVPAIIDPLVEFLAANGVAFSSNGGHKA